MGHTLLVGHREATWREWLKQNQGSRDLLCLDPSDATHGPAGRLSLFREERSVAWRFFGCLDPVRQPLVVMGALSELSGHVAGDAIVQLYPYRHAPLLRQLTTLIAQALRPDRVLIAEGTNCQHAGWPVGPESVELEPAFPDVVQSAQRKAQWLKLLETCEEQTVDLSSVSIEGVRLGSGRALLPEEHLRAGLDDAIYAEVCGSGLLVVSAEDQEEESISRALDHVHCTRATVVEPSAYNDLLCSFARQDGEDFGMGMVQEIDFEARTARVLCNAVPPAPVRNLRIGSLRVDRDGRELGETRPWQV